jgi:hypothetical protein
VRIYLRKGRATEVTAGGGLLLLMLAHDRGEHVGWKCANEPVRRQGGSLRRASRASVPASALISMPWGGLCCLFSFQRRSGLLGQAAQPRSFLSLHRTSFVCDRGAVTLDKLYNLEQLCSFNMHQRAS